MLSVPAASVRSMPRLLTRRTVEVSVAVLANTEGKARIMALPGADLAAAAAGELARLEQLWYDIELPEGIRLELIDGELVMSPTGSIGHSTAISELIQMLASITGSHGWLLHTNATVRIPATGERLIPDLVIAVRQARQLSKWELAPEGVLLAAEVVSPSSRRRDREVKRRAYAQGPVPLYLLVDAYASPPAVTLFSQPGQDGYASEQVAAAGQPLQLPEPFGVALDAARLLG